MGLRGNVEPILAKPGPCGAIFGVALGRAVYLAVPGKVVATGGGWHKTKAAEVRREEDSFLSIFLSADQSHPLPLPICLSVLD